jgi:Flp pilus assembly protein TadG
MQVTSPFHRSRDRQGRESRRSGTAVVEMAFVAPIFFMLIVGIVEFGRMLMVEQVVTNASREGARRAVIESTTESEVEALVNNYMTNASIPGSTVTVDPQDLSTLTASDPVTVTVSVPYNSVTWFPSSWFGLDSATVSASTVMRAE